MRGETSAAESECDRISNLPSDLIRSVIDLLPLKDALRTSMLSKQWRYKWATRSQLLLDDQFIDALRRSCSGDNFQFTRAYGVVIHRLLARINGPIHRIVLYVPLLTLEFHDVLNFWLGFLSSIGMKEITLHFHDFAFDYVREFPCRLFSCVNLTHLSLHGCAFELPITFEGFPYLVSFEFLYPHQNFSASSVAKLISKCPQLEKLVLHRLHTLEPFCVSVPKLRYLSLQGTGACFRFNDAVEMKSLNCIFSFRDDEGFVIDVASYVEEFFNPLSNIEELHIQKMLWDHHCSFAVPGRFPVELPRLKRLVLGPIASTVCNVVHAFCFIQGCPNLQELEIVVSSFYEACSHDTPKLDTQCFFECLETVKIQCGLCSENELRLIENLLACTPVLELMTVEFDVQMTSMLQQLRIAKEQLMGFCRASSRAEIVCMP